MFKISDLVGKTFSAIVINDAKDEIVFSVDGVPAYRLYHDQDCCETVWIEDVTGDLTDLIGSPVLLAEEISEDDPNASESGPWTFYKFATIKGYVDIRWYGSSNGYYSESVSFGKIGEQ